MRFFNESQKNKYLGVLAFVASILFVSGKAKAQRAQFSTPVVSQATTISGIPGTYPVQQASGVSPIVPGQPQTTLPAGVLQQPNFAPGGTSQQPLFAAPNSGIPQTVPTFDPYQTPTQPFPSFPGASAPAQTAPQISYPQGFQAPANQQFGVPNLTNGPTFRGTDPNGQQSVNWNFPQNAWNSLQTDFLPHALDRPRVTHTFLGSDDLSTNDFEIATTAKLNNFFGANQPLRISPGFVFSFWDGPDSLLHPGFDLPAQAYSAYISFDHITDPSAVWGFDSTLRVGYYSDFDNTSSNGLRVTGKVLAWYRMNPYIVGKFGLEYLDRVDVKMLPAFGVYMTPNSDMKLDLYFPRTKLSQRLPNYRNYEGWIYVGAEYGGGSWAIDRTLGANDQVDINDVRAFIGTEWQGPKRVTGFLDLGYVFNREIVYRSDASVALDLEDTLMVRLGFAF